MFVTLIPTQSIYHTCLRIEQSILPSLKLYFFIWTFHYGKIEADLHGQSQIFGKVGHIAWERYDHSAGSN
jgi:hypothetical protein